MDLRKNKTQDEKAFNDEIRKRFNDVAKKYGERHYVKPFIEKDLYPNLFIRKKYILDLITKKGNCLDVGCGPGNLLLDLARRGNKVWGIDISEKMVEEAKNLLAVADIDSFNVNIEAGDFQKKDYPEGFFDVIVAAGFLDYSYDPEEALKKMSYLLKKGGELIISIPNKLCIYRFLQKFVNLARVIKHRDININKKKKKGNYAYRIFSPGQLDKMCKKYRLSKKDFRYFHFFVIPPILDAINPKKTVKFNIKFEKFCKSGFGKFLAGGYLIRAIRE